MKIAQLLVFCLSIFVFYVAYKVNKIPSELISIDNYDRFNQLIDSNKISEFNFDLSFDEFGPTLLYLKKGNNFDGVYKYACKNDTCILFYDEFSSSISNDSINSFQDSNHIRIWFGKNYVNKSVWKDIDTTKNYIEDGGSILAFTISKNGEQNSKYGWSILGLILLGVFLFFFSLIYNSK